MKDFNSRVRPRITEEMQLWLCLVFSGGHCWDLEEIRAAELHMTLRPCPSRKAVLGVTAGRALRGLLAGAMSGP